MQKYFWGRTFPCNSFLTGLIPQLDLFLVSDHSMGPANNGFIKNRGEFAQGKNWASLRLPPSEVVSSGFEEVSSSSLWDID